MNLKIKTKYVVLAVLLALIALFAFGWHLGMSKERSLRTTQENAFKDEIKRYKIKVGQDSLFVVVSSQTILSQRQLIKEGIIEREALKRLNVKQLNEVSVLKVRIDTLLIEISHNGQIIEILDSRIANYKAGDKDTTKFKAIRLPFEFNKTDKWLSLKGTFDNEGKLSIAEKITADIKLITGISKQTQKPFAIVTTDCPYIDVLNVASYKTDAPKDKRYSVSLFVGYGMTNKAVLSPVIGIGIGRTIFKF